MKRILPLIGLFIFPLCMKAQKNKDADTTVNAEIRAALQTWNETTMSRDTEAFLNLFDNKAQIILLAGSDSGEIFQGRAAMEKWISKLFKYNSFRWAMNRVTIDHNGKTAWVFIEGAMIVTRTSGNGFSVPYRIAGVLVKKKSGWKWRLFDGSIPRGE